MKYQGITIHKNKNCDTWYTRFRDINGKQIYISAKTQQQCYDKLKTELNKKHKILLNPPKEKTITLLEWFKTFVKTYKTNVSYRTLSDYENSINHLSALHNKEFDKITSLEIMQELNKIKAERSRQKAYELLSMLFDKAIKTDLINKNPLLAIDKPDYIRKNGIPFSKEDEELFIKICKERDLDMFLVGLYEGMRRGEFLAITDKDIDFEQRTIDINKSLQACGKFGPTKNHSDRIEPMFDKAFEILKKYKDKKGRLFTTSYSAAEKIFNEIRDKYLSNKKYSIKSFRFTFITKCGEMNIPEHIYQKWVGHREGSMVTKQVYTKVRNHAELENIKLFNEKLNSDSTQ